MSLLFIADIDAWWTALADAQKLFLGVGIVAAVVGLALTVAGFVGLDHEADIGLHAGDATGDAEGFSLRAITGFFLGFGWTGYSCVSAGMNTALAALAALFAGVAMFVLIRKVMRALLSLRSDGTMRYENAVGANAVVYVTIPASGATGGQVVVSFDNRSETLPAITTSDTPLAAGSSVKVLSISGRTLTVVAA